jgi:6-phosphogluconolactonase
VAQPAAHLLSAPTYELLSFPNSDALARAAAEQWCAQLQTTTTVALSGGRIATQFFNAVAQLVLRKDELHESLTHHVHFFWADERCVPPDDSESNYGTARRLLFEPLQVPLAHIHRIRGEDDPALAAKLASEELLGIAAKNASGLPILDLIFLGMGEDGHVASLFPDTPPQPGIYYPVTGPKPPPQRITLSYDLILAARQVWVLASGTGKEAALTRSLTPAGDTSLGRVVRGRQNTRILCDFGLKTA